MDAATRQEALAEYIRINNAWEAASKAVHDAQRAERAAQEALRSFRIGERFGLEGRDGRAVAGFHHWPALLLEHDGHRYVVFRDGVWAVDIDQETTAQSESTPLRAVSA